MIRIYCEHIASKPQDINGLTAELSMYIQSGRAAIIQKPDIIEILCPDNFKNAIYTLVQKFGYEMFQFDEPARLNVMVCDGLLHTVQVIKNKSADMAVEVQTNDKGAHWCSVVVQPGLMWMIRNNQDFIRVEDTAGYPTFHISGGKNALYNQLMKLDVEDIPGLR